jgi:hypothetical protein
MAGTVLVGNRSDFRMIEERQREAIVRKELL